jgi:hypothetical protein
MVLTIRRPTPSPNAGPDSTRPRRSAPERQNKPGRPTPPLRTRQCGPQTFIPSIKRPKVPGNPPTPLVPGTRWSNPTRLPGVVLCGTVLGRPCSAGRRCWAGAPVRALRLRRRRGIAPCRPLRVAALGDGRTARDRPDPSRDGSSPQRGPSPYRWPSPHWATDRRRNTPTPCPYDRRKIEKHRARDGFVIFFTNFSTVSAG